tara:strand:+ start:918 stop:1376 length:459 start_codon:yes stop_codon:yes gene_type:complete
MNDDNSYMRLAMEEAKIAQGKDEVPIGAVLIDNESGEVLSKAHNLTRTRHDPSAHAESLAIREACTLRESQRIPNTTLYVTIEPCPMCAALISYARIDRVVFGATDPKSGGITAAPKLYEKDQIHHKPNVISGVMEEDCRALIQRFFQSKRK